MDITKTLRRTIKKDVTTALEALGYVLAISALGPVASTCILLWLVCVGMSNSKSAVITACKARLRATANLEMTDVTQNTQKSDYIDEQLALPTGLSIEDVKKTCTTAVELQAVYEMKDDWYASLVATVFGLASTVWSITFLIKHWTWPPSAISYVIWLLAGWATMVAMFIGVSANFIVTQLYRDLTRSPHLPIEAQLIAELAQVMADLDDPSALASSSKKRQINTNLDSIVSTIADELPRQLGRGCHLTRKKLRNASRGLRLQTNEALLGTPNSLDTLRWLVAVGMRTTATGCYSSMCELYSVDDCEDTTAPSVFKRVVASFLWFTIPVVIVVAVHRLVPGVWPTAIAQNWKSITAVWAIVCASKGIGIDLSEYANLAKPFIPKL